MKKKLMTKDKINNKVIKEDIRLKQEHEEFKESMKRTNNFMKSQERLLKQKSKSLLKSNN